MILVDKCVASDSSFMICFYTDIQRRDWLFEFMRLYDFYVGPRILKEIPSALRSADKFVSSVCTVDLDYYQLVRPFFGRGGSHIDDGEYEAVGIAFHLNEEGLLRYLIIDERRARNFVKAHFPGLQSKLVGTVGFVRDCCCRDQSICTDDAITILECMKSAVEKGGLGGKRPCGLEKVGVASIIEPALEQIRKGS